MQAINKLLHPDISLSDFSIHTLSYFAFSLLKNAAYAVIFLLILWLVVTLIFKLIDLIHQLRQKYIFLEITPPLVTEIQSVSTAQLFSLIAGLLNQHTLYDRLLLRKTSCSFEIVSGKETGIRYILRVPKSIANTIEKNLRSYIPGTKIQELDDYLPFNETANQKMKITEYGLAKHFSLPINEQDDLKKHDPLAYLTGNMTQLKTGELMAMQVILRPLSSSKKKQVRIAKEKKQTGEGKLWYILQTFAIVIESLVRIAMIPLLFLSEFAGGNSDDPLPRREKSKQKELKELEPEEPVKFKLSQSLFEGTVRTLLIMETENLLARDKGLRSSFASFIHPLGQALLPKRKLPLKLVEKFKRWQFRMRLSGKPLILASSEVGALYHFPFKSHAETSELARVRSRELPPPFSLKKADANFDMVIGMNNYAGEVLPIGLTLDQRQKHMYVIGKTGTGKTTLLTNAIYQDMVNGKGLAVFDPHGDMLQELLRVVPKDRRKDVILFDPSDRNFPIGLNLLSPGINFTNDEDKQEWITSSVISVFAKITAKEYWGPRMEHILRNATLTALQMPDPSLYTLQRLLTDKSYQKKAAANLKDPVLKQFWNKEFSLLGKMQLSSVTAPLTQRLGNFITSKMSRHILLQGKSTISMSQIMDEGKILLVNLSKGDLGEDQSFFFGVVLTSLIWMAAYQRTKIPEKQRRDFFLYVDEFQNFATPRFSEITSEGRKFHVSLTASHQNIAQVDDQNILKVVAGNANTIICLKASPDDEKFILPFMEPEVEKGDLVNLAPYHFFMKVTNEHSENAFSGQTVPLKVDASEEIKNEVVAYSREHHATARTDVEDYLERLFSGRLEEQPKPKTDKKKPAGNAKQKTGKVGI